MIGMVLTPALPAIEKKEAVKNSINNSSSLYEKEKEDDECSNLSGL
jgi:hypothetical protein